MSDLSPEIEEIILKAYTDTEFFCKFFFPNIFVGEFDSPHLELIKVLESPDKFKSILAPRGFGKTSFVVYGKCAKKVLFREAKFVVYISETSTLAEQHTENLKSELMANEKINDLFGSVKIRRISEEQDEDRITGFSDPEDQFSKKAWVAFGETLILPRGAGQQVRGLNWRSHRPDLIIFDDLENKKKMKSENYRLDLRQWFESDPIKCISAYDDNYEFVHIDTWKHQDCLAAHIRSSKKWTNCLRLSAFTDDLEPTAPHFMSKERLMSEYAQHSESGQLDVFYREYGNKATVAEDLLFKPSLYKYFYHSYLGICCGGHSITLNDRSDLTKHHQNLRDQKEVIIKDLSKELIPISQLTHLILVDPAKTSRPKSAFSAILGIGICLSPIFKIFIRQIFNKRVTPDNLYLNAINMAKSLKALAICCETTGLDDFIIKPFTSMMLSEGVLSEFIGIHSSKKKEDRIAQIVPYYKTGQIYHNIEDCKDLEIQLFNFPVGQYVDIIDALSMMIPAMKELNISPMFGESEENYNDSESDDPKIFEQLEKMEKMPPLSYIPYTEGSHISY